jgi:hypothetical protein
MIKAFIIGEKNWDEEVESLCNEIDKVDGNIIVGGGGNGGGAGQAISIIGSTWFSNETPVNNNITIANSVISNAITFSASLNISMMAEFKSNSEAIAGHLSVGDVYRNGDQLCIVH